VLIVLPATNSLNKGRRLMTHTGSAAGQAAADGWRWLGHQKLQAEAKAQLQTC